jgi:hypothetical protein
MKYWEEALKATKRKVFISYHHHGDQLYYDCLSQTFADDLDIIYDNSLGRAIDSDDVDYVSRNIRENNISGSSCTILLCGRETAWRKYVDWEIKYTLDKEHGLLGINLPNNLASNNGKFTVPIRLHDNIQSGYAVWKDWAYATASAQNLIGLIELAIARPATLIDNSRETMSRNGTPPWRKAAW